MIKKPRAKLAPTVPGIFLQVVAREPDHKIPATEFPFSVPAIRHLTTLAFTTPVTFFVGENGSGKSTLLEGIAAAFGLNPEGGTKFARFSTRASHSQLFRFLTLTKSRDAPTDSYFLRAESFYNLASTVDVTSTIDDAEAYGGRSLHAQSHGESFMAVVLHRLRGNGLYLFDEPEAALSPTRQLALLAAMHRLVQHEVRAVRELKRHAMTRTEYLETEHYQITKAFLDNPERMLTELLRADDGSD